MTRTCVAAWRFAKEPEGRLVLEWLLLLAVVALLSVGCSNTYCRRVPSTWFFVTQEAGQPPIYTARPTTFVACRPMFGWK